MSSIPDQQQQFKKNELSNIETTSADTTDNTAVRNQQLPTMGSMTSLEAAGSPFHNNVIQQPKEHLFYDAFLESVSNDIVQYLAMKKSQGGKVSTAATPSTPPNHKRRSGARPDGIDRKRSKRNSSEPSTRTSPMVEEHF